AELTEQADVFFSQVEAACEVIHQSSNLGRRRTGESSSRRDWTELRVRRPELVQDNVSLPIHRGREAVSSLIKTVNDKEIGEELMDCNRRLAELRQAIAMFLSQEVNDHVYWVERSGRTHKLLSLHAAPIDVAEFLRRRLFGSDTSVIMT